MRSTNISTCDDAFHISQILMDMPLDPSLTGYGFLREAVELVMRAESFQVNLSKDIYSLIALKHEITVSQIDKSIRNLIYNSNRITANSSGVKYPNYIIRNALELSKSKSLITALAEYAKCCKKKYLYEQSKMLEDRVGSDFSITDYNTNIVDHGVNSELKRLSSNLYSL